MFLFSTPTWSDCDERADQGVDDGELLGQREEDHGEVEEDDPERRQQSRT